MEETPTAAGIRPQSRAITRRIVLASLLALSLAACGIKGPPEPPPDADPKSPRRYPTR